MAEPIKKERAPASALSIAVTNIVANQYVNRDLAVKPQGADLEAIIDCLPDEGLCSGFGQHHTDEPNKTNRVPYVTIRLADIFRMATNPSTRPKSDARWFIPSGVLSRSFKNQLQHGQYHALWFDFDKNPRPIPELLAIWQEITGLSTLALAYLSRSATVDLQKSRLIVPLASPLSGADWVLAQQCLNNAFSRKGVIPDSANTGAAQLCYLPNRGDHYDWAICDGPLCDALEDFKSDIVLLRAKQTLQAHEQAKAKEERQAKRARRKEELALGAPISTIEWFNLTHTVDDILLAAGYDHDGGDNYRHPDSESGSFSARVWRNEDKDTVFTLSNRDPLYKQEGEHGAAHDAFGAYTTLMFAGDRQAALDAARWAQSANDFCDLTATVASETVEMVEQQAIEAQGISGKSAEVAMPLTTIEPFPGVMAEMVDAINATAHRRQPLLAIGATLLAMACGCPGIYRLPSGGRLNLYLLGVLETGLGKEHPRTCAESLAELVGAHLIGGAGMTGQGLEDELPDAEVPRQSLFIAADEMAHWLTTVTDTRAPSHLVILASHLLRLFSVSGSVFRGRSLAGRPAKRYQNPTVNLLGFSTPEKLGRAVSRDNISDGLLGRMLILQGTPDAPFCMTTKPFTLPSTVRASAVAMLAPAGVDDIVIRFTTSAEIEQRRLATDFEKSDPRSVEGALQRRSFEKTLRIAGVLACWDDPVTPCVRVEHLLWAESLVNLSNQTLLRFADEHMHEDVIQEHAAKVLRSMQLILEGKVATTRANESRLLSSRTWAPRSMVLRHVKLSSEQFDKAVRHLLSSGQVEQRMVPVQDTQSSLPGLRLS